MTSRLDGKVALITGASSGIGAATAEYFAELGAKLALTGRNKEKLNETSMICKKKGCDGEPLVLVADLEKEEQTSHVLEATIKHFNQLDILVNNAGILVSGSIENTSLEDYDKQMNINVRSIFHLTTLATPHLISSKGNIVNVSSVTGLRSSRGYNRCKTQLNDPTLAREYSQAKRLQDLSL